MRILELFSGSATFSSVAQARGHECITLDINPDLKPDICMSILDFDPQKHLPAGYKPDLIWASPPCTVFSVAALSRNWKEGLHGPVPQRKETLEGMEIARRTVEIIEAMHPKAYFIENPRGMLRKMPFMQHLGRRTVSYCQYGMPYMKPTDIWTNTWWNGRMCKVGAPCHEAAPRGSKTGLQGVGVRRRNDKSLRPKSDSAFQATTSGRRTIADISLNPRKPNNEERASTAFLRGKLPEKLCEEIIKYVEGMA